MLSDQFSAQNGDRANIQDVCVVITDGQANLDENLLEPYANEAMVNISHKDLVPIIQNKET